MNKKDIKVGRILLKIFGLIFLAVAGYIAYQEHLFDIGFKVCLGLGIVFLFLGQFASDKVVDRVLHFLSGWP